MPVAFGSVSCSNVVVNQVRGIPLDGWVKAAGHNGLEKKCMPLWN